MPKNALPRETQRVSHKPGPPASALTWLLVLVVLTVAAKFLAVQVPTRIQRASTVEPWYLSSGQWLADLRTIGAGIRYLASPVADEPAPPFSLVGHPALADTNQTPKYFPNPSG